MIDEYLSALERALKTSGVRGEDARRVLDEARDHLTVAAVRVGQEGAIRRFGSSASVAAAVAAQRATSSTRRAAVEAFGVLALAGCFVAAFLAPGPPGGWPDAFGGHVGGLGLSAMLLTFVAGQISFVSGCLALASAWRLRGDEAAPGVDLELLRRRTAVSLAAGGVTVTGLLTYALNLSGSLPGWWVAATSAGCLTALAAFAVMGRRVAGSARYAARPGGRAGDLFDDLIAALPRGVGRRAVGRFREHPGMFAAVCGLVACGAVGMAGWSAESDPLEGVLRGAFELLAFAGSWWLLRGVLGLGSSEKHQPRGDGSII